MSRRDQFLPFAQPTIDDEDVEAVVEAVRSGWLTSGPRTGMLETEFATEIGGGAALAVSSGTAAMHIALKALGIAPGRCVITTPMTFCSTAHVIDQIGCRPLFADVQRDTLNIDPSAVNELLASGRHDVAAVLPVHFGGHPVEMDRLLDLARGAGVPMVEDAAHAFGAEYDGIPIGRVGDDHARAVCFSLYATKNITSAEGGMLTGTEELVARANPWRLHGLSRDAWQRYGPAGSWDYDVVVPGFKYNLSDLQAALGRAQLRRWRALHQRRTDIARLYDTVLSDIEELELPARRPGITHAWHLYVARLRRDRLTIDRRDFLAQLRARNIGTSVHFTPLHLMSYYRDRYGLRAGDFPVAEAEFDRMFSLPIYPRMTDRDVEDVASAIRDVVVRHRRMGTVGRTVRLDRAR